MVAGRNTRTIETHDFASTVGMIFQEPESQFIMTSVEDEIAFGMENLGLPPEEMEERLKAVLKYTRLEGLEKKHPRALSGGQKQRVAIASGLALRPEILVLDEPTSELDPVGKHEVLSIVKQLNIDYGTTIVLVEHETEIVAEIADRVVLLTQGKVELQDTPQRVFEQTNLLRKRGLFVPEVADIAASLMREGLEIRRIPVTYSEAKVVLQNT
jgi:energy-coupling factor transport system ATP-binding protein